MIKTYEKFRIPDENKEKEFFAEVNWNPEDQKTNESKLIKFTFPNGDIALVRKEHLNAILFAIGNVEEQKDLIPYEVTKTRWYETTVGVRAKKDIKKGEMIVFPVKFHLPSVSKEVIGDIKKSVKNKLT